MERVGAGWSEGVELSPAGLGVPLNVRRMALQLGFASQLVDHPAEFVGDFPGFDPKLVVTDRLH